jgi:hypothetical protein
MSRVMIKSFKEAWKEKAAEGYQYGPNVLEAVAMGYEMAAKQFLEKPTELHLWHCWQCNCVTVIDESRPNEYPHNECACGGEFYPVTPIAKSGFRLQPRVNLSLPNQPVELFLIRVDGTERKEPLGDG